MLIALSLQGLDHRNVWFPDRNVQIPRAVAIGAASSARKRLAAPHNTATTPWLDDEPIFAGSTTLMGHVVSVGAVIATLARGLVILVVGMLCVAAYTVGSLRRLTIRDREARLRHRTRQRGKLLRWWFSMLGASFIKIGQVMSSRADLFAPEIIGELRELQDRVHPFRFRRVQKILERELGSRDRFREIDPRSIAAGSIAQVHRGVLDSGEEVAIKVLRPGVVERVHRDARLFLWIAHMAYVVSARARAADVIGNARGLVAGLVAQTDLDREAKNYDLFRAHFPAATGVQFPRVYHRYSTRRVLTMEMIHGVHLERIRPEHVPQVTRELRAAFFAMCFEHGLIHADLHPGNILVRDDGSVVLVDVGLVKHLEPDGIAQLVELARCLAIGTPQELVVHLRGYRHAESTDWDAVAVDAAEFMEQLRRAKISNLELREVVGDLFGLARKHRIRPMSEMSLVLLGMVTIEGIAKRLDPDANTLSEIARYLAPRIANRPLARGTRSWKEPPGIMFRSAPARP